MLFSNKLEQEIYQPWKEYYINYNQLKRLLKENVILANNWNETDEQNFVTSLDENLEKVYNFQHAKYDELNNQLNNLTNDVNLQSENFELNGFLTKLDDILELAQQLDHFQRLNYTGFIKIVKKHDRLHPEFNVKPLLNVRLKDLPFHSEDYSPLLYKISSIFQFLRENYDVNQSLKNLSSFNDTDNDNSNFQSFKFWVHPDNLMEVKTTILRHLPVLVFNQHSNNNPNDYFLQNYDDEDDDGNDSDDDDDGQHSNDPIINCLYFDNPNFELYNSKLTKMPNSSTLRLKWLGNLSKNLKISMEKKNFDTNSENFNIDEKILIKKKNINSLIKNNLNFLKKTNEEDATIFKNFSKFINEFSLQPVLRTVYKRTAFQIPGDDKVRITIDSNLLFIREDSFDQERPIRDPNNWHRLDIDGNANYEKYLRTGEFSKFPYSVMEIKIKKFSNKRKILWLDDLINSHLVKEIPNFSKFIHGISSLFLEDDNLDNIPFWFNELENDIKIDPRQYFQESSKVPKIQNDEENLNNFKKLINHQNNNNLRKSFSGSLVLDEESNNLDDVIDGDNNLQNRIKVVQGIDDDDSDDDDEESLSRQTSPSITTIQNKLDVDSEEDEIELPPGVTKPESYIKNAGPLKIEPKVWLANERTFNRWLHVVTLLSSLTFIIYSSANKANSFYLSTYLAYIYFALTIFSIFWSYYIFEFRREVIMDRDGKHLDNMIGPIVIGVGLIIGLIFNFSFGFNKIFNSVMQNDGDFYVNHPMHFKIHKFIAESFN